MRSLPDPITKIDTTYFVRSRRHQSQCSCIHKLVLHLWKCKFRHFDTDHDVDKHQLSKLEHPAKLKCKYYYKFFKKTLWIYNYILIKFDWRREFIFKCIFFSKSWQYHFYGVHLKFIYFFGWKMQVQSGIVFLLHLRKKMLHWKFKNWFANSFHLWKKKTQSRKLTFLIKTV